MGFVKPALAGDQAGELLGRMARALESAPRFDAVLHHEPGTGVGCVALKTAEAAQRLTWNTDRSVAVALEGELFDLEPVARRLGEPVGARTQAALVLALYERFGGDFARDLNGAFAAAIWDRRERTLLVVNDRLGQCPVYYAQAGGGLLFASGVRAVLADPAVCRTVDRVAINQFLVFDHALGDRTLLASVRLLPQASVLRCRDGHVDIRPYWTLQYPDAYEPRSEADYVEAFTHHMRQAVARQAPNGRRAGVLLSGGLDSRVILGALAERGEAVETLTFGIPGCDDARVAAEVAATVGSTHRFVELRPDWLSSLAEEAVRSTDGLGNLVNLHALAPLASTSGYAPVQYKGFLGDALLGYALTRGMWGGYRPDDRYRVHLDAHRGHGVVNYEADEQARLFTDAFRADVGDGVMEAYRAGLDRAGSAQLANQRLFFDLTQRVPRMTLNGVEVARSHATVRLPFCDNDLVDFILQVPPGFLFERYLPRQSFIRHYPRLAQIPLEGTGRPMTSCARDVWIQMRSLASWHLRRRGLGWVLPDTVRPYKDYNGWFRTNLRPWVEGLLLDRRALDRGYFQPAFVRQLLAEHDAGANHAVRIGALLTIELWHRQFAD